MWRQSEQRIARLARGPPTLAGMIVRKRLTRDAAPRAKPHRLPPAKAPWAPAIRCDGRWQEYRMGGRVGKKFWGDFFGVPPNFGVVTSEEDAPVPIAYRMSLVTS